MKVEMIRKKSDVGLLLKVVAYKNAKKFGSVW